MSNDQKYVGSMLPKPDWETAREAVSSPDKKGFVYLPKPHSQYAGKLLSMTDTHLIQQVGKNSAVAHDLSKLENGQELAKSFDGGQISPNKTSLSIKYEQDKGKADVLSYNQQRADQVRSQAEKWAEQNITNAKSRDAFLKHVGNFTKDMAKGLDVAKPEPVKQPQQQPQRQQPEHSR